MNLSIIVTHYNTPELLCLCLDSLKKTLKNIEHETIVVDSESKANAQELMREKYPEVRFIPFTKNVGYAKIVNRGLREARGNYIWILNADIIVLKDAILKMLKHIKNHPEIGILVPCLVDFTNNIQVSCFSEPTLGAILARRTFLSKTKWGKRVLKRFTIGDWNYNSIREVDWAQGSAMLIRKSAMKKVGLWDERFFMYFEDTDWCRRFRQKGYKVVCLPSVKMAHYYHRASKKLGPILDILFNKRARIHIISALKYFWKYRKKYD